MTEQAGKSPNVAVDCPCCGTRLVIDAAKGTIVESRPPVNERSQADLKDAHQVLREESARIEDRFKQIVAADKGRGATMDRRFKDFLDKAKDEPATPGPVRDIDLD